MKWLIVCLLLTGCGTLKVQSTPNTAMQEWMAAVSTWQAAVTDRVNNHEARLNALEAHHAQP